jgi:hypothetical protein
MIVSVFLKQASQAETDRLFQSEKFGETGGYRNA